jgi:hypothetical protein
VIGKPNLPQPWLRTSDGDEKARSAAAGTRALGAHHRDHVRGIEQPDFAMAGFYELRFTGVPADSEPLRFAVVSLRE